MDPKRANEPKWEYKYPEHDPDDKGAFKDEDEFKANLEETVSKSVDVQDKKKKKDKKKKSSVASKIATTIIVLLVLILLGGIGFLGYKLSGAFTPAKQERIPDVTNMEVSKAEKALSNLGFNVTDEVKEEFNKEVEKGRVIGTEPAIGRQRPVGTNVTLIVSKGQNEVFKLDDYVGKNYIEVKTTLEKVYKMKVKVENKDVEITEGMDTSLIIEQSIPAGTEIEVNEQNPTKITLYIPEAYDKYPDFVNEEFSLDDINAFAEKYKIKLDIRYKESDEPEGKIIAQSREPKSKIIEGTTLIITIASKPKQEAPQEQTNTENTQ
jgi:serine/threonine-protein kinase